MKKKVKLWLLVVIFLTAQLGIIIPKTNVVQAADNGSEQTAQEAKKVFAQKPYMGWSSYSMQVYAGNNGISWITAEHIKAQSDAMHEILQPHGYNYINIDAGWNGSMDEYGRPVPSTTLFPNGLGDVINHIHNNGQKVGLYTIPGLSPEAYAANLPIYGTTNCHMQDIAALPLAQSDYWGFGYKIDFSKPCAQSYIDSIADLFGEWGIDFLKFDSVTPGSGISDLSLDARGDVAAWSKALAKHNIWFEISWALDIKYADYWKQYANGWRVDWDVECYCENKLTTWENIARLFPKAEQWWRHAGPGGWNDFDSLDVGNGAMDGMTQDERRSAMTFWSVSSAQLYTGNDLTNLDSFGIDLLTNDEVIAVNQAGHPAHPVSTDTPQQVWYANNGDGSYTVALFNLGNESANVSVNWSDIGLNGSASVRDLWSHSNLGTFNTGYTSTNLASHASRLFKVVANNGTVIVNDDDTGMNYKGTWERNGGKEFTEGTQDLSITVNDAQGQNSTISPAAGNFDKQEAAQSDLTTTMTLNGNTLTSISNGESILVSGTDYTVSGNEVTLKKGYLANRPVGTTILTFTFSAGAKQNFDINVSDSTIRDSRVNPGTVSFDKKGDVQGDIQLTLARNGNEPTGISNAGIPLVSGTDYMISGNEITIKKAYLTNIPTGTTNMSFSFDRGAAQNVALVIKDSSLGGSITLNDDDSAITYTGSWNHSTNRGLGDYNNDVHWSETQDNSFSYTFTGTGVELYTELDPSEGNIDIYVDDVFKQTVSAYHVGRQAQQTIYNITGLSNGPHTIKAVKKSGYFMLLDKIRVSVPDQITTLAGSFDKADGEQADIQVTTNNSLSGIASGTSTLVLNNDYTVSGSDVTLKKEYLATVPIGTTQLVFSFAGGITQNYTLTVSDSSAQNSIITPAVGSFDKNTALQSDVQTTVTANGNSLSSIANGSSVLAETDYTVVDDEVTIKKSYLAAQSVGTTNLTFNFSAGASQTLAITITDTTAKDSSISQTTLQFDKKAAAQADVKTTMSLNGNSLTGISNEGAALVSDTDYTVSGSEVTIKKSYLAALAQGTTNLTFSFSEGSARTVAVIISDSSKGRYLAVNDDDTEISYTGAWQHNRNRGAGDYKDDVHFTETSNDSFSYTFKGTGIEVITELDNSQGDVDIYIDNVFKQTVSTYASSKQALKAIYSITGLSDEKHTIKAVKKSGYYMLLDQLKVKLPDLITPDSATFDKSAAEQGDITTTLNIDSNNLVKISKGGVALQRDIDYTVAGNQVTIKKAYLAAQPAGITNLTFAFRGDYLNDVHFTETNNDSVSYTFKGTGVEWVTAKGPTQGDVDIYIDNVLKQTVSTFSAGRLAQQSIYSIAGLADGTHTIKVVKKSGAEMLVDSLRFTVAPISTGTGGTGGSVFVPNSTDEIMKLTSVDGGKDVLLTQLVGSQLTMTAKLFTADGKAVNIPDILINAKGEFQLPNVPAGTYKMVLSIIAPTGEKLVGQVATLTIDSNGKATIKAELIDPYGVITDSITGLPVQGVKVTLHWADTELNRSKGRKAGDLVELPELPDFAPNKNHDPQTSVDKGQYGWMVFPEADYYILGEKDGYEAFDSRKDLRDEKQGDDSYIKQGNIHVGSSIVQYSFAIKPKVVASGEHKAYMFGTTDGTFKPNLSITRAELAALLTRVNVLKDAATSVTPFKDVPQAYWAAKDILKAQQQGWMKGYSDGKFHPNDIVTRAELAQVLFNIKQGAVTAESSFSDVKGHWAAKAIAAAQQQQLFTGYPDGSFHPNQGITRAETATVLNKFLDRKPVHVTTAPKWSDVPATYWAYDSIMEASVSHSYEQYSNGFEVWK